MDWKYSSVQILSAWLHENRPRDRSGLWTLDAQESSQTDCSFGPTGRHQDIGASVPDGGPCRALGTKTEAALQRETGVSHGGKRERTP